jgi:transcriptional antiterminator RfaH
VRRWYLIHTKASAETLAQVNLERQSYEVYLPRLLQPTLSRGRRRERVVPLFPRYLFLCLQQGVQSLAPVRSSVGVSGVVRFGGHYAEVADGVIQDLRSRADPTTGLHQLRRPAPLKPGTVVHLAAGPFDGLDGIFQRADGAARVVVLLKLLGQDTPVCVPADWIVPEANMHMPAQLRMAGC